MLSWITEADASFVFINILTLTVSGGGDFTWMYDLSVSFMWSSVFRFSPVSSQRVLASQHGHSSSQTRGTAVHQWGGRQRKQRGARLLPHVRVCSVRGDSGHPRANWTLRLRLLLPCLFPAVFAPDSQSRSTMEQVLQISTSAFYRRPRGRPLYLRVVLDFPLRNGACVLKGLGQCRSRVDVEHGLPT